MSAFFTMTAAGDNQWRACQFSGAPEGCEQRPIGASLSFGGQILRVIPGLANEYRLDGRAYQRGHLFVELSADFKFASAYGQTIVFPAGSRVTIKDRGLATESLTAPLKSDQILTLEHKGRAYQLKVLRENYTTGMPQQVEFYANGKLKSAYLGSDYNEDIPLPVGDQIVTFRSSVSFHPNGAVRTGRIYSDFYFIETEQEPLYPDYYRTEYGEEYVIRGATRSRGILLNFTKEGELAPTDPNFVLHAPRRSADRVGDTIEIPALPQRTCSTKSLGNNQQAVAEVTFDHTSVTVTTTSGRFRRRTQQQLFQVERDLTIYDHLYKTYVLSARLGELPYDETPINETLSLEWDESRKEGTLNLGSEIAFYQLTNCR